MANYVSRRSFEIKPIILLLKTKNQETDETKNCFLRDHVVCEYTKNEGDKLVGLKLKF